MRPDQIFRFHWTDDPRKNSREWEAKTRSNMEPWAFASEYDIDYSASVEGVFIPAAWVASCQRNSFDSALSIFQDRREQSSLAKG